MAIANKYELVHAVDADCSVVRQSKLGRHVVMRRFPLQPFGSEPNTLEPNAANDTSTAALQHMRTVASRLASLDHPAIPHVVDFRQHGGSCILITEAAQETVSVPNDLLGRLSQFGRVIDALAHAQQQSVAHGAIKHQHIRSNRHGEIKLTELGMVQMLQPQADPKRLYRNDVLYTVEFIERLIAGASLGVTLDDDSSQGAVARKAAEDNRLADDLRLLLDEHRDKATITELAGDYHRWITKETIAAEVRRLEIDLVKQPTPRRSSGLLVGGVVTAACVCLTLLGVLFWPKAGSEVMSVDADRSDVAEIAQPRYDSVKPSVSKLNSVGTINGLDTESTDNSAQLAADKSASSKRASNKAASEKAASEKTASNKANAEPVSVATQEADRDATATVDNMLAMKDAFIVDQPVESRSTISPSIAVEQAPIEQSPTRTTSPFAALPAMVDLPDATNFESVTLCDVDLADGEPLTVSLQGGVGAAKQATFRIAATEDDNRWLVSFQKNKKVTIAELQRDEASIHFRWLDSIAETRSATQLRNAVLLLQSGQWQHGLALRTPIITPAVQVDFARRRPYDLEIPDPPVMNESVILQVISDPASLAQAAPEKTLADGGEIRIGLDAGKKSLIVVQLLPKLDRRRIQIRSVAKMTRGSKFVPIKKGAARTLNQQLARLNQAIFQRKALKQVIRGKDSGDKKKLVQAEVDAMMKQKTTLEFFIESFALASNAQIKFRVFRQVGDYEVDLLLAGVD